MFKGSSFAFDRNLKTNNSAEMNCLNTFPFPLPLFKLFPLHSFPQHLIHYLFLHCSFLPPFLFFKLFRKSGSCEVERVSRSAQLLSFAALMMSCFSLGCRLILVLGMQCFVGRRAPGLEHTVSAICFFVIA